MDGYPDTDGPLDDTPAPIATPEEVSAGRDYFRSHPRQDELSLSGESLAALYADHERLERALSALKDENERVTRESEGLAELAHYATDMEEAANLAEARVASLAETVGKLRGAIQVVRMSAGWHYLADETKALIDAALTPTEPEAKETTNG